MAGDWIKIEHALPNKPEVMALAELLEISEMEVVGHLVCFWTWVDQNFRPEDVQVGTGQTSEKCPSVVATRRGLDRVAGRTGFADAMVDVGWLRMENGKVTVPNYEDHLSQSAKARAVDAKRKRIQRRTESGQMSGRKPDRNRTRGEERRDIPPKSPKGDRGGGTDLEKQWSTIHAVVKARRGSDRERFQRAQAAVGEAAREFVLARGGWPAIAEAFDAGREPVLFGQFRDFLKRKTDDG